MLNERLKEYRKKKGWTQDDLAERSGYSRSSIINWETGKRAPRTVDIDKLAIVLGIPPRKLLEDDSDTQNDNITISGGILPEGLGQTKADSSGVVGLSYWGGVLHTAMQVADTKNLQQIKLVASLLKSAYDTLAQVIEQAQIEPKGTPTVSAYNGSHSSYINSTLKLEQATA